MNKNLTEVAKKYWKKDTGIKFMYDVLADFAQSKEVEQYYKKKFEHDFETAYFQGLCDAANEASEEIGKHYISNDKIRDHFEPK